MHSDSAQRFTRLSQATEACSFLEHSSTASGGSRRSLLSVGSYPATHPLIAADCIAVKPAAGPLQSLRRGCLQIHEHRDLFGPAGGRAKTAHQAFARGIDVIARDHARPEQFT